MPETSIPAHRSGRARGQALRAVATGLLGLSLLAESHAAPAAQWVLDSGTLEVTARFEGQPVPGRFERFTVRFTPPSDAPGRVEVKVDTASLRFGVADVDRAVAGPEWMDPGRFPVATYIGTVLAGGAGDYVARGELTLKGSQRSLAVPLAWAPETGRLSGRVVVDRTGFGIGPLPEGEGGVAAQVEVHFDLRMRREIP